MSPKRLAGLRAWVDTSHTSSKSSISEHFTCSQPQAATLGLTNIRTWKGPSSCSILKMAGTHSPLMKKRRQDHLALKNVLFIAELESTS